MILFLPSVATFFSVKKNKGFPFTSPYIYIETAAKKDGRQEEHAVCCCA
jgi:hypothetical protein